MIPAARPGTAGNPAPARWMVALLLPVVAAGCLAPGEPLLARLARDRRDGATIAEREQRRRELQLAQQETRDMLAAISAAKARTVETAAALRAVRQQLELELERLHAAELDLAEARARLQGLEGAHDRTPR